MKCWYLLIVISEHCQLCIYSAYTDRPARSHNGCHRPHKEISRCTQTSNTPCPRTSCKVHWRCRWNFRNRMTLGRPPLWSSGQSSWLQNGDILCFLWGTNWIYICYVEESRPPLWPSGQSSWLQIQMFGFDSPRYQIWELVGLERRPFSLVSTTEELLERKDSGSGLENREYSRDPSLWSHGTLYPQKLALTSPTSGGRSVGIVRSRIQETEFF
jgi:hypothetical protein